MPVQSKFKGYDRVLTYEPFKIGDLYYSCQYEYLDARTNIDSFSVVTPMYGPNAEGQTFGQRHCVNGDGFTVIRKRTIQRGIPHRLALNRHFSKQLPLP